MALQFARTRNYQCADQLFYDAARTVNDLTSNARTVNASATAAEIEVFDYGTTVLGFNVSVGKLLTIAFKEISEVAPLQDLQIVNFVTRFHLISMHVVR